jgi:hypothetical protein
MRKKLTTKIIDALPAAVGKRYEVRDELLTRFMVRVSSVGKNVFYLNTCIKAYYAAHPSTHMKTAFQKSLTLADWEREALYVSQKTNLGGKTCVGG